MQMAVVKIVDVPLVLDCGVAAICPVLVRVILVYRLRHLTLLCRKEKVFVPHCETDAERSSDRKGQTACLSFKGICIGNKNRLFVRVRQRVCNQLGDVAIGERIINMLPLAPLPHDSFGPQELQSL
jgi:hypothetical protein